MITRYASTFTDALARLQGHEQKLVKAAAFDLQIDPAGNGKSFHRIERARDPDFWSVRVNEDIRIIVHKKGDALLLAYVDHHDKAYRWAERKRLEVHPRTGAAQFVEIPVVLEEVEQIGALDATTIPLPAKSGVRPFAALTDDMLLDVGVPVDWLVPVRATDQDDMFDLLEHLPAEAAEALLDHATGGRIEDHVAVKTPGGDPYAHPDAKRRFRTVDNLEELKAALEQPFEKWAVFLHPAQQSLVTRDWSGPARVAGTAGTGKTIVALHRAAHLARRGGNARVLLTTFSPGLARSLETKRDILTATEPLVRERIIVRALDQAAYDLHAKQFGQPTLASTSQVRVAIKAAVATGAGGGLTPAFLFEEWSEVVDAWQVADAVAYADVPRLGRKTRLGPRQREAAWEVFAYVRAELDRKRLTTWSALYARLTAWIEGGGQLPFAHIVVDEAQDLTVAQARFLAAFGQWRADALFFAGDLGQRIFHLPFSWARMGLDVRGRSHCLKVNYRTSHQIRAAADRLLPASIADLDGVEEGRRGTVSVFDGPAPEVCLFESEAEEIARVAAFLGGLIESGVQPNELGVLVRSQGQLARARAAVAKASQQSDGIAIATMHEAKGLEFRAVAVMACDEEVLPDPERLALVGDQADLEAIYETERHLLYVALTRARDRLLVTALHPGSEFLEDLGG